MARKPKVSKEETSKPGPKKAGKIQKKVRMVHAKKTQKASKAEARVADSKSISSNFEKNSYDGRRKPKVKHAPVNPDASFFADFFARIEMEIKQQVVEALQPVIYQCTREVISEELKPIRMMVENMHESLNEKIGGLENIVSDRFRDIAAMMQNNRGSFLQELQEEVGESHEVQPLTFPNSNDRITDTNKKLKKRNSIMDTDRVKKSSENFPNLSPMPALPTERKKRGRKPKSFHLNNKTSIVMESAKDVEENADQKHDSDKSKEDISQQDSSQKSDSIRLDDNVSVAESIEDVKSFGQDDNRMEVEVETQPIAIATDADKKAADAESEASQRDDESPQFAEKINYVRFSNLVAPSAPVKVPTPEPAPVRAPTPEPAPINTKNIQVVEPERPKPREVPVIPAPPPIKIYQREPEARPIGLTSQFQFDSSKKTAEKEYAQASSSNEGKFKNDHEFFSFN
jgi:hypothetical protein